MDRISPVPTPWAEIEPIFRDATPEGLVAARQRFHREVAGARERFAAAGLSLSVPRASKADREGGFTLDTPYALTWTARSGQVRWLWGMPAEILQALMYLPGEEDTRDLKAEHETLCRALHVAAGWAYPSHENVREVSSETWLAAAQDYRATVQADLTASRDVIDRLRSVITGYQDARKWEAEALDAKNRRIERLEAELAAAREAADAALR